MAITVNIYYSGKNGSAKAFMEEMISSGVVERIRQEEGNIRYEYFLSRDDPETILLIDQWKSQEALDVHHASPMMKEIADLREKYGLSMRAERFVDDVLPESDKAFLKNK